MFTHSWISIQSFTASIAQLCLRTNRDFFVSRSPFFVQGDFGHTAYLALDALWSVITPHLGITGMIDRISWS